MVAFQGFSPKLSTADLVRQAMNGDRNAFGKLYITFYGMVRAVAFSVIQNHATADDIAQEVFALALTRLDQLRTPAAFPGWLRTAAHHTAINWGIRKKVHYPLDACSFRLADCRVSEPVDSLIIDERREITRREVENLGTLDREALELFYFRGMSLLEMSSYLHAPVGTVKRRLHVARKRLANNLAA